MKNEAKRGKMKEVMVGERGERMKVGERGEGVEE